MLIHFNTDLIITFWTWVRKSDHITKNYTHGTCFQGMHFYLTLGKPAVWLKSILSEKFRTWFCKTTDLQQNFLPKNVQEFGVCLESK